MKENTIILVDYDNVFVTLKNNYRDFRNPNIMYDVITKIKQNYENDNILICKLFADFQKVQISSDGYDILKKNHVEIEHVFNGKNASDVVLMINCIKYMVQYPHIDKIVMVSSDSDLVPIFHEVQLMNKKLEVLYFDVNTSEEHIKNINEIGVPNKSIENLLNLDKYKEFGDLESFYKFKSSNLVYFTGLLQQLNDVIKQEYDRYLKTDEFGQIIGVGSITVSTLSNKLNEIGICPSIETYRNSKERYSNLLDMLMDKEILYHHPYRFKGREIRTLLLSVPFLSDNDIHINNLVKSEDFPS
ncbi:NYN domain-containing protein [Lacrimispora amygdalina]|uniref:NYN domain-containing protein n=1 Tax=Lacrimispora amygdalina TaxID=253257 RepID=A0A3E2N4N4_9FIRM|nr:NYN domain-containing protein [Clostridium indicum]RFZ75936.1 NYN domain-containing protein [Clostridium indicum]